MFNAVLESLTPEMKRELQDGGITAQMRSDWAHDRRNATATQLVILADVAGVDPLPLLRELARFKAHPKEQRLLDRALGKIAAAIVLGVFVAMASFGGFGSQQLAGTGGPLRRR